MKAIQVTKHGVPGVLCLTELSDPQPDRGKWWCGWRRRASTLPIS